MFKFRVNNLDLKKDLLVTFKSIYGIGWYKSIYILSRLGFSYSYIVNEYTTNYFKYLLLFYLDNFIISKAHIDRYKTLNVKKLIDLLTYKGSRHNLYLPVHGQRTRTNANTLRSIRLSIEKLKKLNDKRNRKK